MLVTRKLFVQFGYFCYGDSKYSTIPDLMIHFR